MGCKKQNNEIEADFLSTSINNLNIESKIKWIVVLPGLGCHGCIDQGEAFMQEYIKYEGILFILTKIESLKILQQKINVNIKDYSNIYIDKERSFEIPTENTIYPCIIKLEKGKFIKHEFQSPANGEAFNKLKRKIILQ